MASSASADTDVHSNTSPSRPSSLDRQGLAGIMRGDSVISLLDCPGRKTRKKRENRSKIGGRKKNRVNHGLVDQFNWSGHSVQHSVGMIRKMRMEESSGEDTLQYEDFCKSSVSPEAIGRTLMTSQSPTKNHIYSHVSSASPIDTTSSHSNPNHNLSRSERLLGTVVSHLEMNEYEAATSELEQILSVFANQLDTCQRFGEDVDECNENLAKTLHNIGIVHILNGKFEDAAAQFTRATDIFRNLLDKSHDLDLISVTTMMGLSRYAVEDFTAAKKYWDEAMTSLKEMKKRKKTVAFVAELLNNIGCIHFETGNEVKAIKFFQDSLEMQRKAVTSDVYDHGKPPSKNMLMKLAITQANVAYVNLRLKNIDAAIKAFEHCQKDYELILDDYHPFALAAMDYMVLAHLLNDDKKSAIMVSILIE